MEAPGPWPLWPMPKSGPGSKELNYTQRHVTSASRLRYNYDCLRISNFHDFATKNHRKLASQFVVYRRPKLIAVSYDHGSSKQKGQLLLR